MIFNHLVYFVASKYVTAKKLKGDVVIFRRGFIPKLASKRSGDLKGLSSSSPVGPVRALLENSGNSFNSRKEGGLQGSQSVSY